MGFQKRLMSFNVGYVLLLNGSSSTKDIPLARSFEEKKVFINFCKGNAEVFFNLHFKQNFDCNTKSQYFFSKYGISEKHSIVYISVSQITVRGPLKS
jgi:hypothetical protein